MRLHEIELGANNPVVISDLLATTLELPVKLSENTLTVFDTGNQGVDLNVANHLANGAVRISFITDNLQAVIIRLKSQQITFEGPYESHLSMMAIKFVTSNGIVIVINTPTDSSPEWLKTK